MTNFHYGYNLPEMEFRYLSKIVQDDALRLGKIAFISGPRQVGKSTLAKSLLVNPDNYFLYDNEAFRKAWARSPEEAIRLRGSGLLVLDEIHKDRLWKRKVKGIYDTFSPELQLIVTGSGRLDTYRRGSDSLLGRYIPYRLHPFSVAESAVGPNLDMLSEKRPVRFGWQDLLRFGGFPEPLLRGEERHAQRWSRLRNERLIADDARDIKAISHLNALLLLSELLPERVGSPLSINSLREDLSRSHATTSSWLDVLEALYFCFRVPPYSKRVARAVKQEKKLYLFDLRRFSASTVGARKENLTALHLLRYEWIFVSAN